MAWTNPLGYLQLVTRSAAEIWAILSEITPIHHQWAEKSPSQHRHHSNGAGFPTVDAFEFTNPTAGHTGCLRLSRNELQANVGRWRHMPIETLSESQLVEPLTAIHQCAGFRRFCDKIFYPVSEFGVRNQRYILHIAIQNVGSWASSEMTRIVATSTNIPQKNRRRVTESQDHSNRLMAFPGGTRCVRSLSTPN